MPEIHFEIPPRSDRAYFQAFEKIAAEHPIGKIGGFGADYRPLADWQKDKAFQAILDSGSGVLHPIVVQVTDHVSITIRRYAKEGNKRNLLDEIDIHSSAPSHQPGSAAEESLRVARVAAIAQQKFGDSGAVALAAQLGPSMTQHFSAREAALDRLESQLDKLFASAEAWRHTRENEFAERERKLEAKAVAAQAKLEADAKSRSEELDKRDAELQALKQKLDDRASKHARRQHYKDIKDNFKQLNQKFQVSSGTTWKRLPVFLLLFILTALFGAGATWFLFQTLSTTDSTLMLFSAVKQVTFTILFVSTALLFVRWNNQWFQRHADEEFKLKRLELDIDRASWFVEMAFEWRDEKGEPIPAEVIDRLTRGLFSDGHDSEPHDTPDSTLQALLGANKVRLKVGEGLEFEFNKGAATKVIKELTEAKKL